MRNKKICADVTCVLTVIFAAAFETATRAHATPMSNARFTTPHHDLADREMHVWSTPLTPAFPSVEHLAACLSHEEQERAARVRDAATRVRFITVRVALRHILAAYLQRDPHTLDLRVEPRGKPVIDAAHGVHFSLSHARDIALLAFARTLIGVDVEHTREVRQLELIARRVMHADTRSTFEQLPAHLRNTAFLHAWTQREAHVKAVGGGMFHTADTIPFTPVADHEMGVIRRTRDRVDDALWSIVHFEPAPGSVAAAVARGDMHTLRLLLWTPEHGEPQ